MKVSIWDVRFSAYLYSCDGSSAIWKVQKVYSAQNAEEEHSIFVTHTGGTVHLCPFAVLKHRSCRSGCNNKNKFLTEKLWHILVDQGIKTWKYLSFYFYSFMFLPSLLGQSENFSILYNGQFWVLLNEEYRDLFRSVSMFSITKSRKLRLCSFEQFAPVDVAISTQKILCSLRRTLQ